MLPLLLLLLLGTAGGSARAQTTPSAFSSGRLNLTAPQLGAPSGNQSSNAEGRHELDLPSECTARGPTVLYVPKGYDPNRFAPFIIYFHGSDGIGNIDDNQAGLADDAGAIMVAPTSQNYTWDYKLGGFGPDLVCVNAALEQVFAQYRLDPSEVLASGFSNGASYALSLGLINGDIFTHIAVFAPGVIMTPSRTGMPRIFIAHGINDGVTKISNTSRVFVPQLRSQGYDVTFQPFDGGHEVPADISRQAINWFVGKGTSSGG